MCWFRSRHYRLAQWAVKDQFLFHIVEAKDLCLFKCVVSYDYTDFFIEYESFEKLLTESLKDFFGTKRRHCHIGNVAMVKLHEAWQKGVVHMIAENKIASSNGSSVVKRV